MGVSLAMCIFVRQACFDCPQQCFDTSYAVCVPSTHNAGPLLGKKGTCLEQSKDLLPLDGLVVLRVSMTTLRNTRMGLISCSPAHPLK